MWVQMLNRNSSIVLRFRTHHMCFTPDIEKMYRQINVLPQDRYLRRILLVYYPYEPTQTCPHYRDIRNIFNTIFGNTLPKEFSRL
jgi:hypothetical protein